MGAAAEVCPASEVSVWAERLAAQPPLTVQGTKITANAQLKQGLLASFDLSAALEMSCVLSDDHVRWMVPIG